MTEPVIAQKAPISVELTEGKSYFWCSCGKSESQPFCDGSHKGSSFEPLKYTAEESGVKYFCACKHSKNKPFCDGTHKDV